MMDDFAEVTVSSNEKPKFYWSSKTFTRPKFFSVSGRFYTGRCFAAARCGAALPRGAVNWIQLISTGIFTLQRASVWRRAANWVHEPIYGGRCTCFGTNPPAGEAVPWVKVPFRPLATVPLPFTNSALCKRSSGNSAARQRSTTLRCSKTTPCVKAALESL